MSTGWKTDNGWQQLVRSVTLDNLSDEESCLYLERRHVPSAEQPAVLNFTHGHPLALSLVADLFAQTPNPASAAKSRSALPESTFHFESTESPAIMEFLLEHLVQRAPTTDHRGALQACALVRQITEDLLASMLRMVEDSESMEVGSDVHEVFEWLRHLSFIESGAGGLFLHDLMREVLAGDVRWRNPDLHAQLQHGARQYYLARLKQTSGLEQQRVLADYIFLHRTNPVIRPFFDWQENGTLMPGPMRPADMPSLLEMVAHHEGETSARIAAKWLARQPEGVIVLRNAQGEAAGFLAILDLLQASVEELQSDPGTWAAWSYLERNAPLRSGEGATFIRFWMARDSYQSVSSAQSLIFVNIVRHYLTASGLAFSFFCCGDPDFWTPAFEYADSPRLPETDFVIKPKSYGMFGHDWRLTPPMAWLELLARREVATSVASTSTPSPSISLLSEVEFGEAVRHALRHFARPSLLQNNGLLQARVINADLTADADMSRRIIVLQTVLREACETLRAVPQSIKYYDALYHTYLHPMASQEQVAEQLYVSFSTYRRHLKEGTRRVTELLWQRELGG